MIGSAHVGQRRMLALASEFGWDITLAAIEAVLDGAERQARAVIATWKDGVYRGEAFLDDDGHGYTDIHVRATVTKRGSDLTIDLSDSHPQVAGFVNSSYPNMYSSVVVALCLSDRSGHPKERRYVPPVEIIAKPGTVVWANQGAPVTAGDQPLLAGDPRGDRQGAGARLSRSRDGRLGAPFRIAIQGRDPRRAAPDADPPDARSSGTSSRRDQAVVRPQSATAGRRSGSGRPPAA